MPGKPRPKDEPAKGRFAYEGLDRVLHERARLSIMTSLMRQPKGLLFTELKTLCDMTDGNLNRHLDALHRAGFLEVWKNHENRYPKTLFRVTPEGKKHFLKYLEELERLIHDALPARSASTSSSPMPGWIPAWT
jgi:DNA-binding MarR family transcriptional regulator